MAVIGLRGGNQSPWASFLPQIFQKMMIMRLQSGLDIEALRVKATQDAAKTAEERTYKAKTKLEDKGFTEAPKEFSEDYRLLGQATGMPTKQVGETTMIPPGQPGVNYEYNTSKNEWEYRKPEKVGKPTPSRRYTLGDTIYKEVAGKLVPEVTRPKTEGGEMQTIYGPGSKTKRVPVTKGKEYVPPEGWSLSKPGGEPNDQAIRTFEIQHYGKEVPQLRGTPAYIEKLNASKKAGAVNINITEEKFNIQRKATSGEIRTGLTSNKDDKDYYEANADIFNTINDKNEIAYWDKGEGRFYDEQSKIIKLSPSAISAGWTPKKIQDAANTKGKTVQDVLKDIGLIK